VQFQPATAECKFLTRMSGCAVAGSYFALSLFDRLWHPDLTEAEAISMMEVRAPCRQGGRQMQLCGCIGHKEVLRPMHAEASSGCWAHFAQSPASPCVVHSLGFVGGWCGCLGCEHNHAFKHGLHVSQCSSHGCLFCCGCCCCPHVQAGIAEVKKRLVVAPPHYIMKVVDKTGVREVKKV
jgi:hypothetical protein